MGIGCLVMDRAVPFEATVFHQKENLGFRGPGGNQRHTRLRFPAQGDPDRFEGTAQIGQCRRRCIGPGDWGCCPDLESVNQIRLGHSQRPSRFGLFGSTPGGSPSGVLLAIETVPAARTPVSRA